MFGFSLLCGKRKPEQLTFLVDFIVAPNVPDHFLQGAADDKRERQVDTLFNRLDVLQVSGVQPNSNHLPDTIHLGSQVADSSLEAAAPRPPLTRYSKGIEKQSENAETLHEGAKENYAPLGKVIPSPQAFPLKALDQLAEKYRPLIERVMERLSEAERREVDVHFRDDYRQAWICMSLASKGNSQPFVSSSYAVFGIHPDKVWPNIVAKRQARLAGEYFDWYDSAGNLRPDVPSIPRVREAEHYERLDALTNFHPSGLPVSAPDTGEGDNLPPNRKPSPVHPLSDKERFA